VKEIAVLGLEGMPAMSLAAFCRPAWHSQLPVSPHTNVHLSSLYYLIDCVLLDKLDVVTTCPTAFPSGLHQDAEMII
jgi:hypothetical protein